LVESILQLAMVGCRTNNRLKFGGSLNFTQNLRFLKLEELAIHDDFFKLSSAF